MSNPDLQPPDRPGRVRPLMLDHLSGACIGDLDILRGEVCIAGLSHEAAILAKDPCRHHFAIGDDGL